jgi:hypothetical protein
LDNTVAAIEEVVLHLLQALQDEVEWFGKN